MRIDANSAASNLWNVQCNAGKAQPFSAPVPPTAGQANNAAATSPSTPPIDAPAGPGTHLQGLLSQWGQSGSIYDFTGDGTVDGLDLAQLLGAMAAVHHSQDQPSAPGADQISALTGSWGQADPNHDLNGDGTVDGLDLAMLLGKLTSPTVATTAIANPQDEPSDSIDASNAAAQAPAAVPSTGQNDPAAPATILSATAIANDPAAPPTSSAPVTGTTATNATPALSQVNAAPTRHLQTVLGALANNNQPTNPNDPPALTVRKAIDQLNLGGTQRLELLRRLMAQFPGGMGVNEVA